MWNINKINLSEINYSRYIGMLVLLFDEKFIYMYYVIYMYIVVA